MTGFDLFIGGKAVPGAASMPVVNPATEGVVAYAPRANEAQLNAAIAAAKAAFPAWATQSLSERRALLFAIADDMAAQAEDIAQIVTAEQGKPLPRALAEVSRSAHMMRSLASLDLPLRVIQHDASGQHLERRAPLGVVAAITPWNFPISLLTVKVVPALLAGNTVVAKPAPTTPLSTLRLAAIYNRHLPPGVFNVITDQNDLGDLLTAHPDVAKVSFTGSTATGRKVLASAADLIKRVTLELGGNDAAIVLDDVDPGQIARRLFDGSMINSGQVCLAIKRAYVHASLYDAVCNELAALSDKAVVDDGAKQGTEFGPVQNRRQYERVSDLIAEARQRGKVIAGGPVTDRPGYFIRPTIVRDIDDDARVVREEQFGPVLPVLRYEDINDAILRANDTQYGLAATVWSRDAGRALDVARQLQSGMVWINSHLHIDPTVPAGGAKQSGLGVELGQAGLEEFTQRHVIFVPGEEATAQRF